MRPEEDDLGYVPRPTGPGMSDPAALAIGAVVLATLSLGGFGLLNGASYILPLTQGMSSTARTVLAGLLGAAFALAPVVMGVVARSRTHPGDPAWVTRVAQAGVLLGCTAFVLRLVATAVSSAQVADSGYFAPL